MQKLQTNKGARYMMIAFIVLFLIMILRIVYIQAVGVVHNVNVKASRMNNIIKRCFRSESWHYL